MISDDFLILAKTLASKPDQASQRRAVSSAYYAVFYKFAEVLTLGLLGFNQPAEGGTTLSDWLRVYRAIGHDQLEKSIKSFAGRNPEYLVYTTKFLLDVSTLFSRLKTARHSSDYDPSFVLAAENITTSYAEDAEKAIYLIESIFEHELFGDGFARSLALDVLGVKSRK